MSARVKYPRTYHFPWSPGATSDDRILENLNGFDGERVVCTVKMDGENTSLYRDGMHARSLDYKHHPSRSWMRSFHAGIAADIPDGMRICGENLYARHSIAYSGLRSYFQAFSVWQGRQCLSWDETVEWCQLLGIETVPVLYRGPWDPRLIRDLWNDCGTFEGNAMEGYVVRVDRAFQYEDFNRVVGKFVRANHVQTDQHWKDGPVVPNGMLG